MTKFACILPAVLVLTCALISPARACDNKDCREKHRDPHVRQVLFTPPERSPSDREIVVARCPDAPPCCRDAVICIRLPERPCYTAEGLQSFMAVFTHAATQGVENATIRAFNGTQVAPPCEPKK